MVLSHVLGGNGTIMAKTKVATKIMCFNPRNKVWVGVKNIMSVSRVPSSLSSSKFTDELELKDVNKFPFRNWGKNASRWQLFVGVQGFISSKRLHCHLLEHYPKHSLISFHHLSQQLHFYHQAITFNFNIKCYNIKSSNCYSLCLLKEVIKVLRFHFTT
jgi:hypothetical protein